MADPIKGTKYCFAIVDSSYSWPPNRLAMPPNIFQPWWQKWSQSLAGAQSIGTEMLRVGKDSDACETQPMIPLNFLCHGSPSNYWAHVPGPSGMGNPSLYLKKNLHIQANITETILPCKDKSTYSEAVASSCIFFSTDQKKKRKKNYIPLRQSL